MCVYGNLACVGFWRGKSPDPTTSLPTRCHATNDQAVRNSLCPLLANITVSPVLIEALMTTEPSEAWLQPVAELERILMAVRSGPRVGARKDLEEVVEKLRNRVSRANPLPAVT